ncbi:hypothetical protein DY000_02049645 [Brassica cretica]|uniref:Uncharacterized protein n=1 Tax=Brassica cretica TaxID=69181 RepID=A0ABQ7EV11_BRACR|nr:hypothetical protein DY000_02049645 [Brassica cretica]
MKRKRELSSSNKENDRSSLREENNISNHNECQSSLSNSRMEKLARADVHSSVDIKAVFKRLFGGFEKTQLNIKNAVKAQSTITPKTPSSRRRCVLGVSLDQDQCNKTPDQRSCLTSLKSQVSNSADLYTTQRPNQKKYKRIALNDITNIARDEGLNTSTPKTMRNKRRCVQSVSLDSDQDNNTPYQSSCLTSLKSKVTKDSETKTTQRPIQKKQRKTKCGLLDDITNIANSSVNEIEDPPSNTINEREEEVVPDDDKAIDDCDDDFGGLTA